MKRAIFGNMHLTSSKYNQDFAAAFGTGARNTTEKCNKSIHRILQTPDFFTGRKLNNNYSAE